MQAFQLFSADEVIIKNCTFYDDEETIIFFFVFFMII